MRLLIEGAESELNKIMKENAIRESRGLISFEIEESDATYQGAKRGRKKKDPDTEAKAEFIVSPKGDIDMNAGDKDPEIETK